MNPIKIGMIGFGRMGGFYLEQMQKSGRWEVAYICDVSAESRGEARRLAPQAQVIADEQIIFDDPEVAVVGLFALADSRLSQIGKAVAAGKHIIAEKPIADSVEREWQAVSLVEKAPLFSTVNLYLRNSWYHNTIKEFISSGEIGELAIIRVCHMTPGLAPGAIISARRYRALVRRIGVQDMERAGRAHVELQGPVVVAVSRNVRERRGVRHHAGACLRAVVREADA